MGTVTAINQKQDAGERVLEALRGLIESEIDNRFEPYAELLKTKSSGHGEAEEYLDVEELSRRIHTEPKTIRDWVHKKKIPFQKLPTGGLRFAWSKVDAWIKGEKP